MCFGTDSEHLTVSEIWDSREQMEAWGEKLMPVMTEFGIEMAGEPEVFEVHNVVRQTAQRVSWSATIVGVASPVDLDNWLPDPVLRTNHRRDSPTNEAELWASAATVRLRDCRILGRLVRARIPGLRADLTFAELFRDDPFNPLDEGPIHSLSGLCGRIWTIRRDFALLSQPADFLTWREPGTVRVLFASWAEPTETGSALVNEVRIAPVDRRASLRVRGLRPFISAFQGLVATEALTVASQRAEHASEPGDHEA